MPEKKIRHMSGLNVGYGRLGDRIEFDPMVQRAGHHEKYAGMSEHEMREFMKEEQREGMHPSLRGKRF